MIKKIFVGMFIGMVMAVPIAYAVNGDYLFYIGFGAYIAFITTVAVIEDGEDT